MEGEAMIKYRCDSCYRNTEWKTPRIDQTGMLAGWVNDTIGQHVMNFCSEHCQNIYKAKSDLEPKTVEEAKNFEQRLIAFAKENKIEIRCPDCGTDIVPASDGKLYCSKCHPLLAMIEKGHIDSKGVLTMYGKGEP